MELSALRHPLRHGFAVLIAALALPAYAQDAQQAPPAATAAQPAPAQPEQRKVELGRITVTGTAIPRTSVETASPVTLITAKQIQQSGFTTISDVVRAITADNSGTIPTSFTNGFAAGSSGVALRGLTVNSTLVLIDGHRTAAYPLADDGERSFTDLNSIPLNAVDHIEVLKDGASSLYGADAIAGVVNIILLKSYLGSEAYADIGTSQHGGGTATRATFLTGTGDPSQDRYNAYVNFEYEKDDPIHNRDRGFPFNTGDLRRNGGVDNNNGSPLNIGFFGSTYPAVAPATDPSGNLLTGATQVGPWQTLRPCGANSKPVTSGGVGSDCEQNFVSQYGEVEPEVDRYGLSGRISIDMSNATTASMTASYFQTRVVSNGSGPAQIQASTPNNTDSIALPPTFTTGPNAGKLNPNDPFATKGQYALISTAFGDEPGFIDFTSVNHNVRMVGDVNGSMGADWDYDTALTINHDWLDVNNFGGINFTQLMSDINSGAYSFVDPSSNSAAVLSALAPTLSKTSTTDLDSLDFTANRSLADLEGGSLGLALGGQWRYEAQDDPDLNPGLQTQGLGLAHTIGHRNVAAAFAELDAPLLDALEIDVSGREDHYSDFGSAFSPKAGIKWRPNSAFALRGTYSKGFRAPNFAENGSSASEGFVTTTAAGLATAIGAPGFITAHNNDAYVNQSYALAELASANPNIQPERARNYTLGAIFQPLDSFSGTADYYNIVKTGVIAQPSQGDALTAYFAGTALPAGTTVTPDVPDPLHRTALPRPAVVASEYINENELRTSGVDLDLNYKQDFTAFSWNSDFEATKILTWAETLSAGGPLVSMVGTQGPYNLSSGAGTPRYRASWANTLKFGPASLTGTLYYVSDLYMSTPDFAGPGCFSILPSGAQFPADCRVPSFTYFDLTGLYDFTDNWELSAGILNLFDRKPPFDPIDYAAVNYNPTYAEPGIVGRFFELSLKVKF